MKISVKDLASRVSHLPMSLPRGGRVLCLTCCLLTAAQAQATTPLFQSSFHKPNQDWTVVRGSATSDSSVLHRNNSSLLVERDSGSEDACIRLAPVDLTLGKHYELSCWVRTEALEVRDMDRSPIASGATPQGANVVAGSDSFKSSSNSLIVNQNSLLSSLMLNQYG